MADDEGLQEELAERLLVQTMLAGAQVRAILNVLLPVVERHGRKCAAEALRAAAREQRDEAEQVPWDDEGTHADGHRCAADFLNRRADALDGRDD